MSTVIVLAKAPVPGRVKTRLTPPFTPRQAASLAEAALRDTLAAALGTSADHLLLFLDGEPGPWLSDDERGRDHGAERDATRSSGSPRTPRTPGAPAIRVVPQPGGGLDRRIVAAFAEAARRDAGPALLIGMDTPQVTAAVLDAALTHLAGTDTDAVFGPASDGGFWALGLTGAWSPGHRAEQLVLGVPMSTSETGSVQLQRLYAARLRVAILPELRDVDLADDAYQVAEQAPDSRFARRLTELTSAAPRSATIDDDWSGAVGTMYEQALRRSRFHRPAAIVLETDQGEPLELDIARYTSEADPADETLLRRCTGPTLDIGCGPGRMSAALARRGVPALGIDVIATAVTLARAAGATALRRSVFDPLPRDGAWSHALLVDGNIGIGGDPGALLRRIKNLLRPGGDLMVETAPAGVDERLSLRTAHGGPSIPWARVSTAALAELAEPLGFTVTAAWQTAGRHFAVFQS